MKLCVWLMHAVRSRLQKSALVKNGVFGKASSVTNASTVTSSRSSDRLKLKKLFYSEGTWSGIFIRLQVASLANNKTVSKV